MTSLEMLERTFQEHLCSLRGVSPWQQRAWEQFLQVGLPDRTQESYRYVHLRALYQQRYLAPRAVSATPQRALVFYNGVFQPSCSWVPEGVILLPLAQAWHTYRAYLDKRFATWLNQEKDPFAWLNGALYQEGAFLYIPAKKQLQLTILHIIEESQAPVMLAPRLVCYVGKEAQATVQSHFSGSAPTAWLNGWSEFCLEENARLTLQQIEPPQVQTHFDAVRATLKRDAFLKSVVVATATPALSRYDYHVQLLGEHAEAKLYGLTHLQQPKSRFHTHVLMEHHAPHTTSLQKFKGVVADGARSTFEGKIYVHAEAQKTEAYQMNNHLLLGPKAEAKSKPNLEIFADDVKASHGATCGRLDEEALFYLLTRGVARVEAKQLLINAFCQEVLHETDA